jgi:hypothetical protein
MLVGLFIVVLGWHGKECERILFMNTFALELKSRLLELLSKPFKHICCLGRDGCFRENTLD